jgi:hypothetical protein
MASYLTQEDERNFGPELLDVAIRAARHAVSPELAQLREENQQLHDEVGRAAKLAIDQVLDREVPNWREINADPRWLGWLAQVDEFNGCSRQSLLNDAVARGNAFRVIQIFKGFLREQGGAGQPAAAGSAPRRAARAPSGQRIYDRSEITRMWTLRRQGKIDDQAWARWEYELVAAGREGRIRGALGIDGVPISR